MSNPMFKNATFGGGTATLDRPVAGAEPVYQSYPVPGDAPQGGTAPGGYPPAQTPHAGRSMTFGGTASVAFLMLAVGAVAGWWGWTQVTTTPAPTLDRPDAVSVAIANSGFLWGSLIIGFILAIGTAFVPKAARFTALPYSIAQGIVLGYISHIYDSQTQGIAIQAALATIGVFGVMLALYGLRVLRATPKLVKGVIAATFGIVAMYAVGWIASMFGAGDTLRFWENSGPLGIGISLIIVGVAAFNLILDFDLIERGVKSQAPAYMEWYGAFALMMTLVWLYLEMLRLLSKLRD